MRLPFEFPTPWLALLSAAALKATLLFSLAWLATASMRRAPAAARHLIWTLALIGAIGLPLASWLVPAWPLRWVPALTSGGANTKAPADLHLVVNEPSRSSQHASSTVTTTTIDEPGTSASRRPANIDLSESHTDPVPAQVTRSVPKSVPTFPRIDARALLRLLPVAWLLGTFLLLARRGIAAIRVARLARRSTPFTDPDWRAALIHHAAALGIARVPTLVISDEADVPMTFGSLRPVVMVPAGAVEWNDARRDFVLLHELGHIRRRDTLAQLAGQLAAALYWFHPLVWVAKRCQRAEAEHACDDQVLASGALASAYARELLELASVARPRDAYGAAALAMARRSQLEGRLLTILDPRSSRGRVGRRFVAGALLLTVAATAAIAAARPARTEVPVVAEVPAVTTANPPAPLHPELLAGSVTAPATSTPVVAMAPPDAEVADPEPEVASDAEPAKDCPTTSQTAVSAVTSSVASAADQASDGAVAVSNAVLAASSGSASSSSSSSKSHSSFSIHEDDGDLEIVNGSWTDDEGRDASYKSKGTVRFNDALDDVASIGAGGYLTVEEERNGHRYRAEFKLQGGTIQRVYWVDNDRTEWNGQAREWFADFLVATDRRCGMLAKQRYPRLMAEGGARRVFEELAVMPSDYAKSIYYRMLIEDGIGKEDMRRAVTQAGRDVKSDYELARILSAAAAKGALQDAGTRQAFIVSLNGLESDYEHARVLMMVLERPKLDPAVAADALRSATKVESSYERGRLLVTMAEKGNVTPAIQGEYLKTARTIGSDYEKSRTLRSLVDNSEITKENVPVLISAAATINSDYEQAQVLVAIAESVRLDTAGRQAYLDTARSIGSDYERKRAMAALGEKAASY